jgi:hypothetical protein
VPQSEENDKEKEKEREREQRSQINSLESLFQSHHSVGVERDREIASR